MHQNTLKIYSMIKSIVKKWSFNNGEEAQNLIDEFAVYDKEEPFEFSRTENLLIMLQRLGLIRSNKVGVASDKLVRNLVTDIQENRGDDQEDVLNVFLLYCHENTNGDNYAICGEFPHCNDCRITSVCQYWNKRPSLKELPAVERPRERLIHGGEDQLSDAELLGIIIRDGTRKSSAVDVARKVLTKFGNFRALSSVTITDLLKVEGIGEAKAAQIKAAIAIAKRFTNIPIEPGVRLGSCTAIFHHFFGRLRDEKQEIFYTVLLDNKNRILTEKKISIGTLTSSIVHPREVFGPAMRDHAASVVFVHNHPSGDPDPSVQDIEITDRLKNVSDILGINIVDHLIIGHKDYISFRQLGLL